MRQITRQCTRCAHFDSGYCLELDGGTLTDGGMRPEAWAQTCVDFEESSEEIAPSDLARIAESLERIAIALEALLKVRK